MVKDRTQHSEETRTPQGAKQDVPDPNKIGASTPFDFSGRNLTPYGGLLPVATMLEKLGFQKLLVDMLTVHRIPRAMTLYQFLLAMILCLYLGFSRLNHLRFVAHRDLASVRTTTAMHLLAISSLAVFAGGAAVVASPAGDARTSVGGSQRALALRHAGHRYHRAHPLWPTDGRPQEL